MKVVLFCGGLGTRMWDYRQDVPKPMVEIGYRPILWHVMKYYAYYGHTEFVLALGYKADVVKRYFLTYNEGLSNDFVLSGGGRELEMLSTDIQDWRITFVDTGVNTTVAQRLAALRPHLKGEEEFLANYSDGLTDVPLDAIIEHHRAAGAIATLLSVKPTQSFHVVGLGEDDRVAQIEDMAKSDYWINGGFYVMNREIFSYIRPGDDLVDGPFARLITLGKLAAYPYKGFWTAMDTFKDKQRLEEYSAQGRGPWEVWKTLSVEDGV